MIDRTKNPSEYVDLKDVSDGLSIASSAYSAAHSVGIKIPDADKHKSRIKTAIGVVETGTTIAAGGAAVASATTIGAAATSGAGIATALAGAGSVIGGGMALGPSALAAGPAYLTAEGLNKTAFAPRDSDSSTEATAKKAARVGTKVGTVAGLAGTGLTVVSGGASGAAIMGTLATVGSVVGGGAIAGVGVLAVAPMAVAGGVGYGIYRLFGGGKKNLRVSAAEEKARLITQIPLAASKDRFKDLASLKNPAVMEEIRDLAEKVRQSKENKKKD